MKAHCVLLTIQPHDSPNDGLPGIINTCTLRATGGLIEAQDGSAVELHDYAHVNGGTLQTLGTGEIRPTGAYSSVSDVTVSAGSALVIPNSRALRFRDTVTIDGELWLYSAHGLITGASGPAEDSQLTAVRAYSTGRVQVDPIPTERN